jgi:diguanylate cyclase (GGDEF)-like protein
VDVKWAAGRNESALLILIGGPERGKAVHLEKTVTIGRGADADITIRDSALSRVHARVSREADGYFVEDLGSRNGTFVENERVVGKQRLRSGVRLAVGRTMASFTLSGALEAEIAVGAHERALRDPLTGLYNRGVFEERLDSEWAYQSRSGTSVGVLMVDLDHFKRVNDSFGHQAGDIVLRLVAATMQRVVRRYDFVARYGGEELAIVARDLTARNAEILGERVRSSVEKLRIPWEGDVIRVSISVGVAATESGRFAGPAELVAGADAALYEAKRRGRNCVMTADRIE